MNVLVDTSIWSLALRRRSRVAPKEQKLIDELKNLIQEVRARIIGPIRQEILSGISDRHQFEELKERLSVFEDSPISTGDHEHAAEVFNDCRAGGVQGSHIDILICAVAQRHHMSVFTTDMDFQLYASYLELELHGRLE